MIKIINENLMNELSEKAKKSDRLRTHFNLHSELDEPIHRLCIAAEPDTYMRPHRHRDKWELMIILKGKASIILFDDRGKVIKKTALTQNGTAAVEIEAGVWHVFYAEESGTVLMEVKAGPYKPTAPEDSASWAPKEGEEGTNQMLNAYRSCRENQQINIKEL